MVTRPALADVLAVATTCDDATWWRDRIAAFGAPSLDAVGACCAFANTPTLRRWTRATPADALAALVEAELLPASWLDGERAPRWWCEACAGRGHVTCRVNYGTGTEGDFCGACAAEDPDATGGVRATGHTATPPSLPALVAVAALGVDTLARAEAIVAETWRARVVWRVMTAQALRNHHASMENAEARTSPRVCVAFSREANDAEWPPNRVHMRERWPAVCPYSYWFGDADDDRHGVHRAWPALRAIAALGLHLLAVDDGRVTLGVEAL